MGNDRGIQTLSGFSGRQVASVGSRKEPKPEKVRLAFNALESSRVLVPRATLSTAKRNRGAA